MYELKHRLTPEVAGKTIAEVARHSVPKPNRTTHYYELRSAIFKVVSNEELSSVERGILDDEVRENFPCLIQSVPISTAESSTTMTWSAKLIRTSIIRMWVDDHPLRAKDGPRPRSSMITNATHNTILERNSTPTKGWYTNGYAILSRVSRDEA